MEKVHRFLLYVCLPVILFFSFGCSKEEDENIPAGTPDAYITPFISDLNTDSIKSYVQWMQEYSSRFFLKENRKQIAIDIKNKFIRFGYPDTRIDSFYLSAFWNNNTYATWQYNVIVRFEGQTAPGKVYVIGAHYDCMTDATDPFIYSPGANDNASGIAGMLEIARVIKKRGFVPASTIEFVAFASEEYELNGSDDYVNKASATNKNIVMMLNLDMIAYDPQTDPAKWIVNVMDYGNSTGLRTMFVKCGRTYTNLNFSHNNDYIEDGDSYSFYKKGYQALFIINDAEDSYYHTPDDIIGHYNFPFCKAVTSVACALLVQENK